MLHNPHKLTEYIELMKINFKAKSWFDASLLRAITRGHPLMPSSKTCSGFDDASLSHAITRNYTQRKSAAQLIKFNAQSYNQGQYLA